MDETTNDRPTIGTEGIATVQVHLPSFWPQNPAAWFTHVEAIFALRRITSQHAKYNHAVSALSTEVVAEFHDLVDAPHETNPYDHFKTRVLQRKSVSATPLLQLTSVQSLSFCLRGIKERFQKRTNNFLFRSV
ncbi:hypothetical protein MTO96_045802 [Rhipicephalus appendiculatus]